MKEQVRKIGRGPLALLAILAVVFVVAQSHDDCSVYVKRDFTSLPIRERTLDLKEIPPTTLMSIGYGDHPNDAPAFEQLTLTLTTSGTDQNAVPCVRVDVEDDGGQLRITVEGDSKGADLSSTFASSLQRTREKLPQNSTFASIVDDVAPGGAASLVVRLARTAPHRFHLMPGRPGETFFVLQVRSYRSEWTVMDPAIARRALGTGTPPKIEYRLPSNSTDQTSVQIPVRVTRIQKTEELSVAIPNAPARLHDEEFLAKQLRSVLSAGTREIAPTSNVEPVDPVAGADYEALMQRAETVRRRSGAAARHRYIFARLEAFAREKPSKRNANAYRAIERSFGNAEGTLDDKYLLHLFANFASAKLATIDSGPTRPAEVPPGGDWTPSPAAEKIVRCPRTGGAEPIFDEPVWSWRQQPSAVAYDLSTYRAAFHTRATGEPFDSDALRRFYGKKLRIEVAGTYTTPDDTIAGLAARDGVIVGFLPRAWEGAVIIREGRVHVVSLLELSAQKLGGSDPKPLRIFASPVDFIEFIELVRQKKVTFLQGHLLALRGKYDRHLNDVVRARRRVLVSSGNPDQYGLAIVEFSPSRETTLRQCGQWMGNLDNTVTAINLDMGGWDYGRVYTPSGDTLSLAAQATSEAHLSNKLAFFQ